MRLAGRRRRAAERPIRLRRAGNSANAAISRFTLWMLRAGRPHTVSPAGTSLITPDWAPIFARERTTAHSRIVKAVDAGDARIGLALAGELAADMRPNGLKRQRLQASRLVDAGSGVIHSLAVRVRHLGVPA